MKKCFVQIALGRLMVLLPLFGAASFATADQPQQARVSQIIEDVRLLEPHGAPRPAVVNDKVTQQMGVRTGVESRAELTFTDLTLTRLGANTIFSFKQGARELDLTSGAVLLQVPPKAPAVKVTTSAVTAAVTGGTALISTGPPTKFMVLEGIGTFFPNGHPDRAVTVHGGEMMTMTADRRMTKPQKFDVKLVMKTSRLIKDFPPLENMPLIMDVMNQQLAMQLLASITQPLANNLINVVGTTDQNANANPVILVKNSTSSPTPPPISPTPPPPTPPPTPTPSPPTPTPSPSGTPTKFGTPATITSPNPYIITSDTIISTDPSITTNGVTDLGKIYRGQSIDGAFSAWGFGSTSPFDTASGFDSLIGDNSGAAFKFTALQLNGDPTIDTTNGETNLALIAVNGITSGAGAGELNFDGIRGLLLATQNGPITLGAGVSFSGLDDLIIYARGSASDLTLGSDITTTNQVSLIAERDLLMTSRVTTEDLYAYVGRTISIDGQGIINAPTITLFAGQDLHWVGQISDETAFNSNGNVNIFAGQTLDIRNDLTIIRRNGGITSGLNVALSAGGDFLVGGNLAIATDISNLTDGANIALFAGENLTVGGSLALETTAAAQSGTGANINLLVGGSLTAADLFLGVELAVEAPQLNGENITLATGQDLTVRNDSNSGGVDLEIITPVQQTVNSGANLILSVGNNLTTDIGGDTTLLINNNINHVVEGANIFAAVGGNLETNNLSLTLLNNGGEIGTGGLVTLVVAGDLIARGDAIFDIQNNGGAMDTNTAITVAAGSLSANSLSATIENTGGVIAGAGLVQMNVKGNANVTNDATLAIYGSDGAGGSAINVFGGNYEVGGTFLSYIDGAGTIAFNNASVHGDVLKAGVFGANGALIIGGGTLSADETLKLYAPGSNGQLNFVSNVTLGGNSKKILAADSITIFDNVVVTIGGDNLADVFTNHPNYTGFGGNGSTTGTFGGAGANRPRPLSERPPFDPQTGPGNPTNGKRARNVINVKNSGELLSLLDGAVPGRGGKLRVPHHNQRNSRRADRLNVARMARVQRQMTDMRQMRDRAVLNNRLGSGTRAF
ncbi:MAG TPA: FecR family protein [Candidatus Udaeobacter sp.]|nr:FecR family protein [Candidatus Udaeobacter sp.]